VVDRQPLPVNILFDGMFSVKLGWRLQAAAGRALCAAGVELDVEAPPTFHCPLKVVKQYSELFYVVNHIIHGRL